MVSRFQTARCGELVYDERDVIVLPEGLIGLPALRRWLLLEMEGGVPMRWLQSLDRGDFGFPVMEPQFFADDYEVEPSPGERDRLGLTGEPPAVLVVTTVHPGGARITGNLLAPLLVDPRTRRGLQVALERPDLSMRQEIDYFKFGLAVRQDPVDDGIPAASGRLAGGAKPEGAPEESPQTVEVGV